MSGRTGVDIVLAEFAAQTGLERLELGPDDQVALKIGDTPVVISYVASPTEFVVCTIRIAGIEPEDLAKANAALEMTFTTWMNGVMTLGLSETGRDLQGVQRAAAVAAQSGEFQRPDPGHDRDRPGHPRTDRRDGRRRRQDTAGRRDAHGAARQPNVLRLSRCGMRRRRFRET